MHIKKKISRVRSINIPWKKLFRFELILDMLKVKIAKASRAKAPGPHLGADSAPLKKTPNHFIICVSPLSNL